MARTLMRMILTLLIAVISVGALAFLVPGVVHEALDHPISALGVVAVFLVVCYFLTGRRGGTSEGSGST